MKPVPSEKASDTTDDKDTPDAGPELPSDPPLEEPLTDYRDFLRTRNLSEITPDRQYTQRLSQHNRTPGANYETFRKGIENADSAICANVIIGLIKVTNFPLDRQIQALEKSFLKHGGLCEAMTRARVSHRAQQKRKQ